MNTKDISNFNYVNDESFQKMFSNAYQAIQLTETWDFMKKDIDSYMWSRSKEVTIISNKMTELGYDGHSGTSFGFTMREMQFIAQYGLDAHKNLWLEKK
jgi:hypothetical protein